MIHEACPELVAANIEFLKQAHSLLSRIDDEVYSTSPKGLDPYRVGSHLRHLLESYECFFSGLLSSRIDYDARSRDQLVEGSRQLAAVKIASILGQLEKFSLPTHQPVSVRIENSNSEVYLNSSIGRELQALSSHTVHHFALISVALRLHGVAVEPEFGMSPSTLRYQAAKTRRDAA